MLYGKKVETGSAQMPEVRLFQLKLSPAQKGRIYIISDEPVAFARHYKAGLGYVLCFDGACCEVLGERPNLMICYPMFQYDWSEQSGKFASYDVKFGFVSVSDQVYRQKLVTIKQAQGKGLDRFDYIIGNSNAQYSMVTDFQPIDPPAWSKWPDEQKSAVWAKIKAFKDRFYREIETDAGRAFPSPAAFLQALSESAAKFGGQASIDLPPSAALPGLGAPAAKSSAQALPADFNIEDSFGAADDVPWAGNDTKTAAVSDAVPVTDAGLNPPAGISNATPLE